MDPQERTIILILLTSIITKLCSGQFPDFQFPPRLPSPSSFLPPPPSLPQLPDNLPSPGEIIQAVAENFPRCPSIGPEAAANDCVMRCRDPGDCRLGEVCCYNGCGRQCISILREEEIRSVVDRSKKAGTQSKNEEILGREKEECEIVKFSSSNTVPKGNND